MSVVWLLGAGQKIDTDIATVAVNQIVILCRYDGGRYVVAGIANTRYGNNYKLINLKTEEFETAQLIRPLSQKFGIGYYFDDANPEFINPFETVILMDKAEKKRKEALLAEEAAQKQRQKISEEGKVELERLIPVGCTSAIMAYLHEDDSDAQTDYFNYKTVRSVILGFSSNSRNSFSEMRKYAANFEETKHLAVKNEKFENRENYTGGSGYYLGESKYSGWIVKKTVYSDREKLIEYLSYTAGNNENFHLSGTSVETSKSVINGNAKIEIIDYSDKSVAVFGETKAIKDYLHELKGLFNDRLRYKGKICPGWIFPKSRKSEIESLLIM